MLTSSALILNSSGAGIDSLLPYSISLTSQISELLASNNLSEVKAILKANSDHETDEYRYNCILAGFTYFKQTNFAEAGPLFTAGQLDPRIVMSYFPDIAHALFKQGDNLNIWEGVMEHMPTGNVFDVVENYAPYLDPTDTPTRQLSEILLESAREMLQEFLLVYRTRHGNHPSQTIDTALAFLLRGPLLESFLQIRHGIDFSKVESAWTKSGQLDALARVYEARGETSRVISMYKSLIDKSPASSSPDDQAEIIDRIFAIFRKHPDRKLLVEHAPWLVSKDVTRTMQLLTSPTPLNARDKAETTTEQDRDMLRQLTAANPIAGTLYLEYLVIRHRSQDPDLHTQLALRLVDDLYSQLADKNTSKLWRAKAASYASQKSSSHQTQSFLSYFSSTTPSSAAKSTRLRCLLFLEGSQRYNASAVHARLKESDADNVFPLELSIVEGKLGNDQAALDLLVHSLHDAASAEAYCALGGAYVVPPKVARIAAEREEDLEGWADALFSGTGKGKGKAKGLGNVTDARQGLVQVLLQVYMKAGDTERTSHLLNSQATKLDPIEVISLVPPSWPLSTVCAFLARSLRQITHDKHERMIVKALSAGQNLDVAATTWLVLREQGAVLEDDEDDEDEEEEESVNEIDDVEKVGSYDEKAGPLLGTLPSSPAVAKVEPRGMSEGRIATRLRHDSSANSEDDLR